MLEVVFLLKSVKCRQIAKKRAMQAELPLAFRESEAERQAVFNLENLLFQADLAACNVKVKKQIAKYFL